MGRKDAGKVRGKMERGTGGHQDEKSRRKEEEKRKEQETKEDLMKWREIRTETPPDKRYEEVPFILDEDIDLVSGDLFAEEKRLLMRRKGQKPAGRIYGRKEKRGK